MLTFRVAVGVCFVVGVGVQFLRTCRHFVQSICVGAVSASDCATAHTETVVPRAPLAGVEAIRSSVCVSSTPVQYYLFGFL